MRGEGCETAARGSADGRIWEMTKSIFELHETKKNLRDKEKGAILGVGWILARLFSFFNVVSCHPAQRAHAQAGARGAIQ